jgi:hypothetical protein
MTETIDLSAISNDSPPKKRVCTDYSQVMRDYVPVKNPLSSFIVRPPQVSIGIQEADEKILLMVRRHFFTNTSWIIIVLIMLLAAQIVGLGPLKFLPDRFITATIIVWYLFTAAIAINGFLSWFYNVHIVTDERVVDLDFINLVYKNIASAKIQDIQDVTVEMGGAFQNIFDYGTVFIQTAAERNQFEYTRIPHPHQVAKLLNELKLEEEREDIEGRVN